MDRRITEFLLKGASMALSVHKRRFHAFLSHAHADREAVDRLHTWLREKAGIPDLVR